LGGGTSLSHRLCVVNEVDNTGEVVSKFENLKTILIHFKEKIGKWESDNPDIATDSTIIMSIIQENYESLKLKLFEDLDVHKKYVEKSKESMFIRQSLRTLVISYKEKLKSLNTEIAVSEDCLIKE